MDTIDLSKISKLASQKTGEKIEFINFEKIGSGYHSDGFKLTTRDGQFYFLKYVTAQGAGFEFPERQIMSLLISNGMEARASSHGRPVGVMVMNKEEGIVLPEINEETKVFHLQKFAGTGTSYVEILKKNLNKKKVDEEDIKQLTIIADELVKIHSIKHLSKEEKRLRDIYNDGLLGTLINPELSISTLSQFPNDYQILDLEGQKEMITLMYENIKVNMNNCERLVALHGDFWGGNIFFKDDGSMFLIDFSRIPWGDPAIDVGWFISQYLWYYHTTGNRYFRELTEYWLNLYEQKSGDKEIRGKIPLVLGWTAIIQVHPFWFPNIDLAKSINFINHIKEILKQKKFLWNN